jgi:hypothetical protein
VVGNDRVGNRQVGKSLIVRNLVCGWYQLGGRQSLLSLVQPTQQIGAACIEIGFG